MKKQAVTDFTETLSILRERGFAVLDAESVSEQVGLGLDRLLPLDAAWDDLPLDPYLKDGGSYRRRRHSSLILDDASVNLVEQRPHYQPLTYNALHGGMHRWFEPCLLDFEVHGAIASILRWLQKIADAYDKARPWFCEVHQFRIDTAHGIGRPTPEGAHRDGVDFVAVFLINRVNVRGGETYVFRTDSEQGQRFTLSQPWSVLLMDDARVIHETTPIQPDQAHGWRDTLVITLRAGGFLAESQGS